MAVIDIGEHAFILINIPLFLFNMTANIFYAWSLFWGRRKLKQPLKCLLGYLVLCTITFCVTVILMESTNIIQIEFQVVWIVLVQYTHCSMTCYVWLNFYYYVSIVPQKRAPMVWIKKNIKSVIYWALICDTTLYLAQDVVRSILPNLRLVNSNNQTLPGRMNAFQLTFSTLIQAYILLCMLIMMVSSFSTAHYLGKHIRNFAKSTGGLTNVSIQGQIRVTIAGILQGISYFLYYSFYLSDFFVFVFHPKFFFSRKIFITATTLFFSVTTVNVGISQIVIRERIADVLKRVRVVCGVSKVTNDVRLHTSPVT